MKTVILFFFGHSHVAKIEKTNNKLVVNPGSITKSRVGENSFAILSDNNISIRNLNNEVIDEYII